MKWNLRLAWIWLVVASSGCADPVINPEHASAILSPGPHRGALRQLEGADGFIEVVTEPVRDAPSGSPKFRVAVYFLDQRQTGPLVPAPTEVEMTATWPDSPTPETIHLTIDPAPGDPTGAAKFAAPPAEHTGEPTGTLRARLRDHSISASL